MNNSSHRQLRESPPRTIDILTQATIIFGGILNQIGWIFVAFGMVFLWIFIAISGIENIFTNTENWKETQGTIEQVLGTNSTINEQPVIQYNYTFQLNENIYTGQSFTTGERFDEGEEVAILFEFNDPEQSVIKDARRAEFGSWILLVLLIFPLIGSALVFVQTRLNLKNLRLLKIGNCTFATLKDKTPTNGSVTINNRRYPVYKYSFEFSGKSNFKESTYKATCKTHLAELVEDEEREIVLYDRENPKINAVYDAIPNAPMISPRGTISPATASKMLGLIIPFLTIAGNCYYVIFLLTS